VHEHEQRSEQERDERRREQLGRATAIHPCVERSKTPVHEVSIGRPGAFLEAEPLATATRLRALTLQRAAAIVAS
jgi:hypothetical protein